MLFNYMDDGQAVAIPFSSIAHAEKDGEWWRVFTLSGREHTVSNDRWEMALATMPITSTPAQSGTYIVSLLSEEDGSTSIDRINVVAWSTYADGSVRPVTMVPGEADGMFPISVLMPDGSVEANRSGYRWKSIDQWQKEGGGPSDR